jgi:hypothetical protein
MVISLIIVDFVQVKPTTVSGSANIYKTIVNITGWAQNYKGTVKIAKTLISALKSAQPSVSNLISSVAIDKATGRAEITVQIGLNDNVENVKIDFIVIT